MKTETIEGEEFVVIDCSLGRGQAIDLDKQRRLDEANREAF